MQLFLASLIGFWISRYLQRGSGSDRKFSLKNFPDKHGLRIQPLRVAAGRME